MRYSPTSDGPPVRRHPRRITPLIFLAFALLPANAQLQEPDTHANKISGVVLNSVTHEPIGRALVFSRDNRLATFTDSEGHFEFEIPAPDTQNSAPMIFLAARKPGFLENQNSDLEVAASPGRDATLDLVPEAIIKGRISFPDEGVPPGLAVSIFVRNEEAGFPRWIQHGVAQVNSDGEFRFADLVPGDYRIGTNEMLDNNPAFTVPGGQLYGIPPSYSPGVSDFSQSSMIHLSAGQIAQADFAVARQPYYPVRIPVAANPDANGMNVTVSPQGHRGPGYSLGYNAERQRIEGSLPNGNYIVEAATFGQNSANASVSITVNGGPTDGPTLTLTRNLSLAVNVREEFSATNQDSFQSGTFGSSRGSFAIHGPRLYLNLSAFSAEDFGPQTQASLRPPAGPNDDSLVLENLSPGRYWLAARSGRGYVASATRGGVDLLHSPFVVSAAASEAIEITVRDDGAQIDGTISGMGTAPASIDSAPGQGVVASLQPLNARAWIYCIPQPDASGDLQLAVSEDGKFNLQNLAPGSYRVIAFRNRQPGIPYRDVEAMKAYESKGQIVHLSAGQKTTLQVQLISNE